MIVATARYLDRAAIQASGLAPLASTVEAPKFALGYRLAGSAGPVAPVGIFGPDLPAEEFRLRYRERLDESGVERLRALFEAFAQAYDAPGVVLLCFCREPDGCHWRLFAEWWEEQTGEVVDELDPPRQLSFG